MLLDAGVRVSLNNEQPQNAEHEIRMHIKNYKNYSKYIRCNTSIWIFFHSIHRNINLHKSP